MSWVRFMLGKPKEEPELATLRAENTRMRRWLDDLHTKFVRARAHQEQLSDLRRIVCDQRLELHRLGKLITSERRVNSTLRDALVKAKAEIEERDRRGGGR